MKDLISSIQKTLVYQEVFDFAPNEKELHRFLISDKKYSLSEIRKAIKDIPYIKKDQGLICFCKSDVSINSCILKRKYTGEKIKWAMRYAKILSLIPWYKMIGISGAIASNNATKDDDIDFFVITSANRIWLARFSDWIILNILHVRRNAKSRDLNNKVCINFYLSEDNLELKDKDLYIANEIARLIPLYGIKYYVQFVKSNDWINKYLGNFWEDFCSQYSDVSSKKTLFRFFIFDWMNTFLGNIQQRHMEENLTREKVTEKEIRFHPKDSKNVVLSRYKQLLRKYKI